MEERDGDVATHHRCEVLRAASVHRFEAVDEAPNLVGSPGLFGNASDAEIFIDNILVTKNTPKS